MHWSGTLEDFDRHQEFGQMSTDYALVLEQYLWDMVQSAGRSLEAHDPALDGARFCLLAPQTADVQGSILADKGLWVG